MRENHKLFKPMDDHKHQTTNSSYFRNVSNEITNLKDLDHSPLQDYLLISSPEQLRENHKLCKPLDIHQRQTANSYHFRNVSNEITNLEVSKHSPTPDY
jgi:hypothetical protein